MAPKDCLSPCARVRVNLSGPRLAALALAVAALGSPAAAGAAAPGSLTKLISLGRGNQAFALQQQRNGDIVIAGRSAGGRVLVEKFNGAGRRRGMFVGPSGYARAIAFAAGGKIVVAGSSGGGMYVERLTRALRPDRSFSGGVRHAFGGGAIANGVAVGRDGSVVVAGSVTPPITQVGVAKFRAGGRLQWSRTFSYGRFSAANGLALQRDGKIVLVGQQTPLQTTNGLIIRLKGNGTVDYGFKGGAFTYHYPGGGYTVLNSVLVQGNGKIVAAGIGYALDANAIFLRLNRSGSFDGGFGRGGVSALPSAYNVAVPGDPIGAFGVAIGKGGRVVGAGNFEYTGAEVDAALWSLTPRGARDSSFGGGTVRQPRNSYENCGIVAGPKGSMTTVGNTVTGFPDVSPCTVNPASHGFIARYAG